MPVYPLKKGFQIRFERNGKPFSRNYPDLNRKQAELLEAQMLVKNAMGELHQSGEEVFSVFARQELTAWAKDHWSQPQKADHYLEAYEKFFGQKKFNEISPLLISSFKLKIKKETTRRGSARSEKTVNRYLAVLSRVFWLAIRKGVVKENPCHHVERYKESEGRIRYLSDEEFERLEAALPFQPEYLQVLVAVAMNTALRWSSLVNLKIENLNFAANSFDLSKTKSGYALRVPMNEKVKQVLFDWIQKQHIKKGFLFVNPKTNKPYTHVRKSLATLLKDAKIENFTFHSFRHDAITQMVDAGINLPAVAEIAGHRNIQTTMKYAHGKEDRKRQAVEVLGKRSGSSSSQNVVEFKKKSG